MEQAQGICGLILRRIFRAGPITLARGPAKICDSAARDRITFADLAGMDQAKAQLADIVEFLKNPAGTILGWMTFRAQCCSWVCRERARRCSPARLRVRHACPSSRLPAPSSVRIFVGPHAADVSDVFKQAQKRAPCIVFIDESDAIDQSHGGWAALDQLLVEAEFDASKGVVIMAATSWPLDQVRPGRFERLVLVDRPDLRGREAILRALVRGLRPANSVDMHLLAQKTIGMVGRDLANAVDEAASASRRRCQPIIEFEDFAEAIDRIRLGLDKKDWVDGNEKYPVRVPERISL